MINYRNKRLVGGTFYAVDDRKDFGRSKNHFRSDQIFTDSTLFVYEQGMSEAFTGLFVSKGTWQDRGEPSFSTLAIMFEAPSFNNTAIWGKITLSQLPAILPQCPLYSLQCLSCPNPAYQDPTQVEKLG